MTFIQPDQPRYKQPLRPHIKDLSKWKDPNHPYYYYKSLILETISKILTLYGVAQNKDVTAFVVMATVVLIIDSLGSFPLLLYGLIKLKRTGKGANETFIFVFEGVEYLTEALYTTAALVLRGVTGQSSIYDQLQLCVTSVSLALRFWKFSTSLVHTWTDNYCIVCSNKVYFAMCMYMIILIGSMTAFQVMGDLMSQIFIYVAITVMYFVYAIFIIFTERACCRTFCFRGNVVKCCCHGQLLINHPELEVPLEKSSSVEIKPLK